MNRLLFHRAGTVASVVLGVIFGVAGFGKLFATSEGFERVFNPFPSFLTPAVTGTLFNLLPYLEIIIAVLLIGGVVPRLAGAASVLLIAGFMTNNGWLLGQGRGYEPCSCFGVLDRIVGLKISTTHSLYLDILMLALALITVFGLQGRFFGLRPRFSPGRDM